MMKLSEPNLPSAALGSGHNKIAVGAAGLGGVNAVGTRSETHLATGGSGTRVQTSADVHRSGGASAMNVPPQLSSAVATAGQTISEATAAASNLATGFIK